jgi:methionyl-tRNA formyltransferase
MERVTILCSDPEHPVNSWLERWMDEVADRASVVLVRDVSDVDEGDFLFLIACHQIVKKDVRDRFRFVLVVHGSRLPHGRGWSPLVWQSLAGVRDLPLALINAEDGVDTGDIWRIETVATAGTELHHEIQAVISEGTTRLMTWALDHCRTGTPVPQQGEPSYYARRRPADSQVRPDQSIAEIFDLLRIADPHRYPAWFEMRGKRYTLSIARTED